MLKDVFRFLRVIGIYMVMVVVGLIFFVPCLLLACLPEQYRYNRVLFWLLDRMYKGLLYALGVKIAVTGREHILNRSSIFVANHESSLDIPFLGSLMNGHAHVWYVIASLRKTPLLGFFVERLGVFVDPQSPGQAARALRSGIARVQKYNCHTLIFPEGGRYVDGSIHPFLHGFALIAQKTGYPVIPVFLRNTGVIRPPHSAWFYPRPLYATIGEPFYWRSGDTLQSFSERVHGWFVEQNKMIEHKTH